MDVIETAIRNALEKGDADDRAFRERVYRSAFAALDRALKANPNLTVEAAIGRRKNLQAKIAEIESEFIPAVQVEGQAPEPQAAPAAPHVEMAPSVDGPAPPVRFDGDVIFESATPDHEPVLDPAPEVRREPAPSIEPAGVQATADPLPSGRRDFDVPAQTEPNVDPERRRPFAMIFVVATIVALIGVGGWWAVSTGLFKSAEEIDTGVPNPPGATEDEDFDPGEEEIGAPALPGDADRNWISVFTPADPTLVSAPGDTRAEVMQDDSGSFMRIRSGASGSAVVFDVGQGILEQLAGRKAVFDIVAKASEEGAETQISVICNFGELGDCGRKRYAVGTTKSDFLFEIDLPAKQPGAAGTIAITSDIEGGQKSIDIFEIRAAISE